MLDFSSSPSAATRRNHRRVYFLALARLQDLLGLVRALGGRETAFISEALSLRWTFRRPSLSASCRVLASVSVYIKQHHPHLLRHDSWSLINANAGCDRGYLVDQASRGSAVD